MKIFGFIFFVIFFALISNAAVVEVAAPDSPFKAAKAMFTAIEETAKQSMALYAQLKKKVAEFQAIEDAYEHESLQVTWVKARDVYNTLLGYVHNYLEAHKEQFVVPFLTGVKEEAHYLSSKINHYKKVFWTLESQAASFSERVNGELLILIPKLKVLYKEELVYTNYLNKIMVRMEETALEAKQRGHARFVREHADCTILAQLKAQLDQFAAVQEAMRSRASRQESAGAIALLMALKKAAVVHKHASINPVPTRKSTRRPGRVSVAVGSLVALKEQAASDTVAPQASEDDPSAEPSKPRQLNKRKRKRDDGQVVHHL